MTRKPKRFIFFWLFVVILITGSAFFLFFRIKNKKDATVVASSTQPSQPSAAATQPAAQTANTAAVNAAITTDLQNIIANFPGDVIGISYVNLKTGQTVQLNGDHAFTAASTTKLITAVYVLQQIEKGNLDINAPLGAYTVGFQLQQMVNQSNNDSWDYFNNLYPLTSQQNFARSIGINSFTWNQNTLSPNDDVTLLQKLYTGQLLNTSDTQLLLGYMQNTNEEGLLPSGLPNGWQIYHKYGELDDNVHDGGIITNGNQVFILAIFTNGQGDEDYTARAAIFTQAVQAITAELGK